MTSGTIFLFAFDFDHTLLDGNCDLMVQAKYSVEPVPEYFKIVAKSYGVTKYMKEMFRFRYPAAVGEREFQSILGQAPWVPELPECLLMLKKLGGELIVISDANTYFIRLFLKEHKMLKHFHDVIANPGYIDSQGQLVIRPYMNNLECQMSSRNLCKGKVLMDYIAKRQQEGQSYRFVGFAGDGINDYCPMYRLRSGDLACARKGFSIGDFIASRANDGVLLRAKLVFWKKGADIIKAVQDKLVSVGCLVVQP